MTKTKHEMLASPDMVTETANGVVSTIVELSDEDTDLVAGGPEVQNDPPNH